jgi:hypothetical protein
MERTSWVVCPHRNVPAAYRHFFPAERAGVGALLANLGARALRKLASPQLAWS